MGDPSQFLTLGDLARETGATKAQVNYCLDVNRIVPVGRVGILRVFSRAQLLEIRAALHLST